MNRHRWRRGFCVSLTLWVTACSAQSLAWRRPREPGPIDATQHMSMVVGLRTLDFEAVPALEDQPLVALHYELQPVGAAVALDLGLAYSQDDTSFSQGMAMPGKLRAGVWEASVGLYKEFEPGVVHPYVGAGFSLLVLSGRLTDDIGVEVFEEDDASLGSYARGGVLWGIYPGAQIGLDVRYVNGGDLQVGDLSLDGDYIQAGVIFRGAF